MSYSYSPLNACTDAAPSNGRLAAAALLAISAGACFGVAVTPVVTSLYTASAQTTAATRVSVPISSRPVLSGTPLQNQPIRVTADNDHIYAAPSSSWSSLGAFAGAFVAAAATAFLYALRGSTQAKSEQLAIAAIFGSKKAAPAPKVTKRSFDERPLWFPTAEAPDYLDGSLPGDRGFDPLGLSKPQEFLQMDFDQLDQNAPKNQAGQVIGVISGSADQVSANRLQPYSEVFGLQRFRECELIHGRWAMMGVVGVLFGEAFTGVPWQNAGLVELSNPTYFGNPIPFSNTQILVFEVLAMGLVEVLRNTELDVQKRCYPGGAFDPLNLSDKDDATKFRLQEAEIKHARLAMIAFLGFAIASAKTGLGATMAFNSFANIFSG